ncbi:helix-turn-helix domain-containing protein [Asanoa sp. NPDC049573]|uniref:helix-turn-helix domain-containing protein n=1 Tax=Asanoa sp. NPDC049573 TaxID=3155396 RepID=UPI0034274C85
MPPDDGDRVEAHIDKLLAARGMTPANLSILKNGRARAVRFSTLSARCTALGCQPGDLFTVHEPRC